MKYIKQYENFTDDFEIGDIVVSLESRYADKTYWLHENYKYKIVDIIPDKNNNKNLKVQEVGFPYSTVEEYVGDGVILNRWFPSYYFLTVEDWELKNASDKYNV